MIQAALEPWTSEFLAAREFDDADLGHVHSWLEMNNKPAWDDVREKCPSVKAYWQQFEALVLKNGVMYHRTEPLHGSDHMDQLLLPPSL